jgi:3-hydroxyisobutyrate dehydrogenase-like beta-hydroxyacid dehydrogenase
MGLPMATNLVKAGVHGHGARPQRRGRRCAGGCRAGARRGTDADVDDAQVIVTMLPDDAIVDAVLGGHDGVIARARPGTLLIEMSTTSPATKTAHAAAAAARGVSFVECPVGKTMEAAIAGTLTLMAGGDAAHVERGGRFSRRWAPSCTSAGRSARRSAMKLINNALVACINAASIEALVAGRKANLGLDLMMGVFKSTMAWNQALAGRPAAQGAAPRLQARLHDQARAQGRRPRAVDGQGARRPMTQGAAAYAILEQALRDGYGADDNPGSDAARVRVEGRRGALRPERHPAAAAQTTSSPATCRSARGWSSRISRCATASATCRSARRCAILHGEGLVGDRAQPRRARAADLSRLHRGPSSTCAATIETMLRGAAACPRAAPTSISSELRDAGAQLEAMVPRRRDLRRRCRGQSRNSTR